MTIDHITEDTPDHHFRTEIPNIIFELGLTPFDIAVYSLLKRVAGDGGKCTCRRKTMIEKLGMSSTTYDECLKRLASIEVGGVALIRVFERFGESGGQLPNEIRIGNIWGENGKYFREKKSYEQTPPPATRYPPSRHTVPLKKKNDKLSKKNKKNDNDTGSKKFTSQPPPSPLPKPSASRCRPSSKDDEIIVFDPETYRLPNGDRLSPRMRNALKKYRGEDWVKLLANVAYAEDQFRKGKVDSYERYLQACISQDFAGSVDRKETNRLWATFVLEHFKPKAAGLKKSYFWLNCTYHGLPDGVISIDLDLDCGLFARLLRQKLIEFRGIDPDVLAGL